jgi:hypothetical protein
MKRLVLLVLVAVGALRAQMPDMYMTHGFQNCRWWRDQNLDTRLGYMLGADDATAVYANKADREAVFSRATKGEYVDGVTELCKAPENGSIPLPALIVVFVAKYRGETDKQINTRVVQLRKIFNVAQKGGAK